MGLGIMERYTDVPAGSVNRLAKRVVCFFCVTKGVGSMPQGTIKKLITDKGFGFIESEQGDIFFHHSALVDTTIENLQEGQNVEYEVGSGPKGPRAENVKVT